MNREKPLVSVVMPCLNEEKAIGICIKKIKKVFEMENIDGEIVVCDNGSTDNSVAIAESMGVRVIHQPLGGGYYPKHFRCSKKLKVILFSRVFNNSCNYDNDNIAIYFKR